MRWLLRVVRDTLVGFLVELRKELTALAVVAVVGGLGYWWARTQGYL